MLQLVLDGGLLLQPLHILSPAHSVGVEPTTLRVETPGRTTTPVDADNLTKPNAAASANNGATDETV